MTIWRHYDHGGVVRRAGARNMAFDEWMLATVRAGAAPAIRFYGWSPACLSFGRNQPALGRFDAEGARREGVEIVRRPTGGQAVLHDDELTYAVALPVGLLGAPRVTYRRINEGLVAGLRRLGVAAEIAGDQGLRSGTGWDSPCFVAAAPGEIVLEGRKLVGSAQRREGRALLQHGSILLGGDQRLAAALLREPAPAVHGPPATLSQALTTPVEASVLAGELALAFAGALGIALAPADLSGTDVERVGELALHYGSAAWTWRR